MNPVIGEKIRRLRKKEKISLLALATESEISVGHLTRIEKGKRNPTYTTLCKIASGLHISVSELTSSEEGKDDAPVLQGHSGD